MKREQVHEKNAAKPDAADGLQKKPYQRPALRVFGSVHLLTRSGVASTNGDGGALMMVASDRAAKENIARIGQHPLGFGVYLFDYLPEYRNRYGHGRQFGVMADEVQAVLPEAVATNPDGLKSVNYALLGIHRTVQ